MHASSTIGHDRASEYEVFLTCQQEELIQHK